MTEHTFTFRGQELVLHSPGTYVSTHAPMLVAMTKEGEPYMTITVNLPDAPELPTGCSFIKSYSENAGLVEALTEQGYGVMVGAASSGFVVIPIFRWKKGPLAPVIH